MIIYEPNKNWFRDIRNLTTSWTLRKIMNGIFMVGVMSTVVCGFLFYLQIEPRLNSGIFSLLGIVLSILLVFRTNTAYDRWWEGRKQWGALVNNTRNLALMLNVSLPKEDKDAREFFARHIANFCVALRDHLRNGTKLNELDLTEKEEDELKTRVHPPNYLSMWLYSKIHLIYKAGIFTDADLINLKGQQQSLLDILGACERIKKTPIPFSYSVYIKFFVSIYCLLLPFGLYMDFGWYTVPLTMFISFAMIGLELMAQEIEEPFGLDCNDLPTGDIAMTIKRNVYELLENQHVVPVAKRDIYSKVH